MKRNKTIATIMFVVAMIFFHYHSTGHYLWALMGIKTPYPLDPVEGWWAFLKGVLPVVALWIIFFAGIVTKNKKTIL